MPQLTALPTNAGLNILKQALYDHISEFALVDDQGNEYYSAPVHSVYFDDNGVLTISCIVPVETHFTNWNKFIRLKDNQGIVIAEVETPPIQFIKGVGGEIPIKITVTGEPATIVFKNEDFITPAEARELFLKPLVQNTRHLLTLENLLIEKGIISAGGV